MSISPSFLDELRTRLNLSDVIGARIKVTRAGREHKACCPFHHEKTPSFTINDDKQFYHCFGCGAHGDVVKFVMEHDNLPFRETVELLAGQAGLTVPKASPQAAEKADETKRYYQIMEGAAAWFAAQLRNTPPVVEYIKDRGLSGATVDSFQIGFAPSDGGAFVAYMQGKGVAVKDLEVLGLAKVSQKNNKPYAFFRDRVVFPVKDRRGRVVAFGGRILPDHMRAPDRGDFKPPKYLNSPDTPIFDKGRILYGADKAKDAARDQKPILVVEGYMDVVACHQSGYNGAVAPMGTALTEGQIETLWKMIPADMKEPILCFDGDNAGQKAAGRAFERMLPMLSPGHSAQIAFLPQGEDPDSLLKKNDREAFSSVLASAVPLVKFMWRHVTEGKPAGTPEQKAALAKQARIYVSQIENTDVRGLYKGQIEDFITTEFYARKANARSGGKSYGQKGRGTFTPSAPAVKPKPLSRPQDDGVDVKILLACLINYPHIYDHVEDQFMALFVRAPKNQTLKGRLMQIIAEDPEVTSDNLLQTLHGQGAGQLLRDILHESVYVHAAFAAPCSDSNQADTQEIVSKWLEIWEAIQSKQVMQTKAAEWKSKL